MQESTEKHIWFFVCLYAKFLSLHHILRAVCQNQAYSRNLLTFLLAILILIYVTLFHVVVVVFSLEEEHEEPVR